MIAWQFSKNVKKKPEYFWEACHTVYNIKYAQKYPKSNSEDIRTIKEMSENEIIRSKSKSKCQNNLLNHGRLKGRASWMDKSS